MSDRQTITVIDPISNQPVELSNPGQVRIYQLRKAFREGSFYASNDLPPELQAMLNKPTQIDSNKFQADPLDQLFLAELIKKIEQGEIELFRPSSLLNQELYNNLPAPLKAKAEFDILILSSKLRAIKKLWDLGEKNTYQMLNLVHSLRLTKEGLEKAEGDIFII